MGGLLGLAFSLLLKQFWVDSGWVQSCRVELEFISSKQLGELLVVLDGQKKVPVVHLLLLFLQSDVTGKLAEFGDEVLDTGGHGDGGLLIHSLTDPVSSEHFQESAWGHLESGFLHP